jgi:hypothetical protein
MTEEVTLSDEAKLLNSLREGRSPSYQQAVVNDAMLFGYLGIMLQTAVPTYHSSTVL